MIFLCFRNYVTRIDFAMHIKIFLVKVFDSIVFIKSVLVKIFSKTQTEVFIREKSVKEICLFKGNQLDIADEPQSLK